MHLPTMSKTLEQVLRNGELLRLILLVNLVWIEQVQKIAQQYSNHERSRWSRREDLLPRDPI